MTTLQETLSELREHLLDQVGKPARTPHYEDIIVSEYYAPGSNQNREGWIRRQLRADFEGGPLKLSKTAAVHLAMDKLAEDLDDLIQNGDMRQYNDAWLHALDGVKVRGHQPVDVWVPGAMILEEYSKSREQYEYIVYTVLYVKWEDK